MYAQRPAGTHHPAGIPDNYVITPFGYFHPSCVIGLAKGDTQIDNGHTIQHKDGSFTGIPACGYPRYSPKGEKIAPDGTKQNIPQNTPSIGHAWIEDYSVTTKTSFGILAATWTVPQTPLSSDDQILYLFPGLCVYGCSSADPQETILQPVLGWNDPYARLGPVWSIASWNCCYDGNNVYSQAVPVNPGDTILGTIQSTCGAGTLSCSTWNIKTYDETTGGSTSLDSTPSYGQTFNWAFAGVLEVYNIAQCSDYPPNGQISFSGVYLTDNGFNQISNPGWTLDPYYPGMTPQCGYGGQTEATQIALDYSPNPQALAPAYTSSTTSGPSGCGNSAFGYNNPCYETYTASVSVAQAENLYINGTFVGGTTYNYSNTENWGTGQCAQFGDQGEFCWGYANPGPLNAYATESGYSESSIVNIY